MTPAALSDANDPIQQLGADIRAMRGEMQAGFEAIRGELDAFSAWGRQAALMGWTLSGTVLAAVVAGTAALVATAT
jgi:hypothetical protein